MRTHSITRRSRRAVVRVTVGAATAATMPGRVMVSPVVPSEMPKSAPMAGSRPMGRISLVTMAKMPSMSEATASRPTRGGRGRASVVVDMIPVRAGARDVRAPSQAGMK